MTPRKQAINPPELGKPLKPYYSNCVRVESGPLLFISGQVALDGEGTLVGGSDLKAQARQVFENIRTCLLANGATMSDVLKVTVYVTDMRAFHELTELRTQYWPVNGPASTLIEVSKLALPELLIEVEAIAAVP
jgi:2-iminobutanoate/2-iminopropanoate deaminase